MTFSPDGKQLTTASADNTAQLWDTATGKELQLLTHDNAVNDVAFSPDGNQLATASADNTARLWDTATGQERQRLTHNEDVEDATFSPDGKQIATASKDKAARLWDAATGQELHRLRHNSDVKTVIFSPDGKQLATAGWDKSALLWDTATGQELQRLSHDGYVISMTFSPDGKQLATASADNTARLWDAATGKELQRLNHDNYVRAVTFSPDGKQLATASDDNTARLWIWQPEDLINQLCSRLLHNLSWDHWQNYFEDEPYRKTCEQLPVAPGYQEKGNQLVMEGKTAEAVRMIQQLNAADPALKLDQEQALEKWTAPIRLEEAEQLLKKKKIPEAIAAFNRVDQMDSTVISAESWNYLCWQGALGGYPEQALDACEKAVGAVTAEQRWFYQDSRGLARALTGNSQGAIEDFEFFIKNSDDEQLKKQRQAWVQALRAGQNPFTKEELATLQDQ